jgi:cohesin loading factor subunit SCC2
MTGLSSREAMMHQCKEFLELLAHDDEVKVPNDDAGEDSGRFDTPSVEDEGDAQVFPSREPKAAKRKNSTSVSETPKRPRKRGRPSLGGGGRGASLNDDGPSSEITLCLLKFALSLIINCCPSRFWT